MSGESSKLFSFVALCIGNANRANAFESDAIDLSNQGFLNYAVSISETMKRADVQPGDHVYINSSLAVDNLCGLLAASLVGAIIVAPILVQDKTNQGKIAFSLDFGGRENRFGKSISISEATGSQGVCETTSADACRAHESVFVVGAGQDSEWNSRVFVSHEALIDALKDMQPIFAKPNQTVVCTYPCQSLPYLVFSLAAIYGGHIIREYQAGRFDLLGDVDIIMCDPSQLDAIAALPRDALNDASLCVNLGRQGHEKIQNDVRADIRLAERFSEINFSDAADSLRDPSRVLAGRQDQLKLLQDTITTVIGVKDVAVFPSVKHDTDENIAFIILADGVNRLQRFALIKKAIRDALGQDWLPKKMWQVDSIPKKESGAVDIGRCQDALRNRILKIDDPI
jgi:hypothetical protein